MWGQTRPRTSQTERSIEQIDLQVADIVNDIFTRNTPNNWPGAELQAVVFEVEDLGGEEPRYGYHYWLQGVEVDQTTGLPYFTPGLLEERGGFITPPQLTIDDVADFLAGIYGTTPQVRRYTVSPEGDVTPVEE